MAQEDYGLKVAKKNKDARSKDRKDLSFDSATATYMVVQKIIATVNTNPYVIIHGLGYVPKIIVYEMLTNYNRKLPYDDGTNQRDFSVTNNEVKIRGVTSGTFVIYIFAQPIL